MEMWELVARERIRDTLARYNWAGDGGDVNGLAETFCTDGVLQIRGAEPLRGRSAIASFLGGVGTSSARPTSSPSSDTTSPTCCSPD